MTLKPTTSPDRRVWPEQGQWTYDDWLELPDDGTRYEVIDGVLHMTPAPSIRHQLVAGSLFRTISSHVVAGKLGVVLVAPVDVRLPGQPIPFKPDIVFVSAERHAIVGEQLIDGAPDLVVEVLSPSNWPYDRNEKFRLYRDAGVPEYWIADYRAETIEVYALEQGEYVLLSRAVRGDHVASCVLPSLAVDVDEVFRQA
jgi:Uma2 family endonuclease